MSRLWKWLVALVVLLLGRGGPREERERLVAPGPRNPGSELAAILLRSWRRDPDLVRVLVREVGRSQTLPDRVEEIGRVFAAIRRTIERGQAEGAFRPDLDPKLASWIFYGGIEEVLTGWVLGQLDDGDEAVAAAERAVVEIVVAGLASGTAAIPRG